MESRSPALGMGSVRHLTIEFTTVSMMNGKLPVSQEETLKRGSVLTPAFLGAISGFTA